MKLSYKELKMLEDCLRKQYSITGDLEIDELRIRISQELSKMEHQPNRALEWRNINEQSNFNR